MSFWIFFFQRFTHLFGVFLLSVGLFLSPPPEFRLFAQRNSFPSHELNTHTSPRLIQPSGPRPHLPAQPDLPAQPKASLHLPWGSRRPKSAAEGMTEPHLFSLFGLGTVEVLQTESFVLRQIFCIYSRRNRKQTLTRSANCLHRMHPRENQCL